jgi:hypothetical protein
MRYVSRPRKPTAVWADEDSPLIMSVTVCDHDAVDTGLIDERRDPIMRVPNPIGFGRDDEW